MLRRCLPGSRVVFATMRTGALIAGLVALLAVAGCGGEDESPAKPRRQPGWRRAGRPADLLARRRHRGRHGQLVVQPDGTGSLTTRSGGERAVKLEPLSSRRSRTASSRPTCRPSRGFDRLQARAGRPRYRSFLTERDRDDRCPASYRIVWAPSSGRQQDRRRPRSSLRSAVIPVSSLRTGTLGTREHEKKPRTEQLDASLIEVGSRWGAESPTNKSETGMGCPARSLRLQPPGELNT